MSTQPREAKPTLAGVQIKTRKRNIAVALDPGSFADAVIAVYQDARVEGEQDTEKQLQAGTKALEGVELDFSRYGDTLFEVLFAGGRMAAGGSVVGEGKKLETNVLAAAPEREAILPYVKQFQALLRRRPFLIRPLENTLIKLLLSLDFYDEEGRTKTAIAAARCFALKLGVQPDRVLQSLLNDRVVAKGLPLQWATAFFTDYLATEPMDDLVALLRKARMDSRLVELFPPQKRNLPDFDAHFQAAGLSQLVDYNRKKTAEVYLEELKVALTDFVEADPPQPADNAVQLVRSKKAEWQLPEADVIKVMWRVLADAVPRTGKNAQQVAGALDKQIRTYKDLLNAFCNTSRAEQALIVEVQVYCYEDSKLLKLFKNIVSVLYDENVLSEETVLWWNKKGAHPKGRTVFQRDMEPFIKWLEEAEEEEEEDDD